MKRLIFIWVLLISIYSNAEAQKSLWSFELHGGVPYNIPAQLSIEQSGMPSINMTARYSSEPMTPPVFWVWRISRWRGDMSWEFEAIHHKLYLEDMPAEVQQFSISHGYNILTINRAMRLKLFKKFSYIVRIGAGAVLSHPENEIREKKLQEHGGIAELGYYFTGPVLNFTIGKQFNLYKNLFFNSELKFTPSVSWVPISTGEAEVWNFPISFAFGLGVNF